MLDVKVLRWKCKQKARNLLDNALSRKRIRFLCLIASNNADDRGKTRDKNRPFDMEAQ